MVLDTWFPKPSTNMLGVVFNAIYVNDSNSLLNLQQQDDTYKVRLIKDEFPIRMWDTQEV